MSNRITVKKLKIFRKKYKNKNKKLLIFKIFRNAYLPFLYLRDKLSSNPSQCTLKMNKKKRFCCIKYFENIF